MQKQASVLAKIMLQAFLIGLVLSGTHAFSGELRLRWDANQESDIAGYKIYYGGASRDYEFAVDVGNKTNYTISGLQSGQACYVAATAYDSQGNESAFSTELVYLVQSADSDGDGICDDDERDLYRTDPNKADTDGDLMDDGHELAYWEDAWAADSDSDGLANLVDPDSDGDGWLDGEETEAGSDPSDPDSLPPLKSQRGILPIIRLLLL